MLICHVYIMYGEVPLLYILDNSFFNVVFLANILCPWWLVLSLS